MLARRIEVIHPPMAIVRDARLVQPWSLGDTRKLFPADVAEPDHAQRITCIALYS